MDSTDAFQPKPAPQIDIPKSPTKGKLNWTWGSKKNVYRSFENAKTYVRALELESGHSYKEFARMYVKGGPLSNFRLLPPDIPVIPERVYTFPYGDDQPFDLDDFLGTKKSGRVSKRVKRTADGKWHFPYEEFKKRVRSSGVRSETQYKMWRVSVDDKFHLPCSPEQVYLEWEGWSIVLMNDIYTRTDRLKYMMPFDQAIKHVHTLQLRTQREYHEWWKEHKPLGLPVMPERVYQKDWVGWPKFLGTVLEARLEVAKLNVDVLVIAKLKLGNDMYRIYVDPKGHAHALANVIDDDQVIEMFRYNRDGHQKMVDTIGQYCIASHLGNTVVHCSNIPGLIRALNITHEVVRWKEVKAVGFGKVTAIQEQKAFADQLLIPGRDPIFDQKAYHFDPFDHPDADFLLF